MPLTRHPEPIAAEPTEHQSLDLLTRLFAEGHTVPQLMHPDERPTVLPHSLYEIFKEALPILLRGDMVSIVPVNRLLTTQEAANLLNVSREYVRRLMKSGDIPHVDVGRHHRIPFSDLMAYRTSRNTLRREALRNVTQVGEDSGYFDWRVLFANFPVVLDACVLYPAALRDTLLRASEYDLYTPYWSMQILEEMRRNLVADGRLSVERSAYLIAEMTRAFPDAAVTGYESLIAVMENHPKDRHVLAVAVKARAQVIVTSNLADFPEHALAGYEVRAKSPDAFLLDLLSVDARAMVRLIHEQLADLRGPDAVMDRLLAALTRQAPGFVEMLQIAIDVH